MGGKMTLESFRKNVKKMSHDTKMIIGNTLLDEVYKLQREIDVLRMKQDELKDRIFSLCGDKK